MKPVTLQERGHEPAAKSRKPRHLAERMQGYLVKGMGIVGAVALAFLLCSFMQTGSGAPPWMR